MAIEMTVVHSIEDLQGMIDRNKREGRQSVSCQRWVFYMKVT